MKRLMGHLTIAPLSRTCLRTTSLPPRSVLLSSVGNRFASFDSSLPAPLFKRGLVQATEKSHSSKALSGWRTGWSGVGGKGTLALATGLTCASFLLTQDNEDTELPRAEPRKQLAKGDIPSRIEDEEEWGLDRLKSIWAGFSESQKTLVPLIAINTLVFLAWRIPTPRAQFFMRRHFTCSPENLRHRRYHTVVTSAFSHSGAIHFLFNMTALWTIAPNVVDILGKEKFSLLYLNGAVVSSLVSAAWQARRGTSIPSLGASGALMSVLWVFVSAFPDSKLALIFLPFIPISSITMASAIATVDVAGALLGWQALDHAAHLGGAVVGIAYFYALRAMDGLRKWDNYGTADLPGGHTYEGQFRGGKMHGQGRLTFGGKDKEIVYVGEFKNGLIDGYGVLALNRSVIYDGHLKEGKFHGKGIFHANDGSLYRGDWVEGKKEGQGVLFIEGKEDGSIYKGQFKDDRFFGHGTLLHGSRVMFEGEFEDNGDGRWRATGLLYAPGRQTPTKVVWVEEETPVEAA